MKKIYLAILILTSYFQSQSQWNTNTSQNLEAAGVNAADIETKGTIDGKSWLAFYSQNGNNYDMRTQLIDANGNKLLGDNGIVISTKKSGSATFVFNTCVDNDNNLIIAYQYQKSGAYIVTIQKINQAGTLLWGSGGIDLGAGLAPWPIALSNNDIAVAWSNDGIINFQKIISTGTVAWTPVKEISISSASVTRPQLVANTNNSFGIVYQRTFSPPFYTHLWEQRYDADGNPIWANAVQISTGATAVFKYYSVLSNVDTTYIGYSGNPQTAPSRFDAFVQRVNADGSLPWGINGTDFSNDSHTYYELTCDIAYLPGSNTVWAVSTLSDIAQGKHGISTQKFDAISGAALLSAKGKTIYPVSSNFESAQHISLCEQGPVFTFTDASEKLFAVGLDMNGNFAWTGNSIELGSTLISKGRFGFTSFVNNQAVAVWSENKGMEDRAYAQNITCDGHTGVLPVTLINFKGNIDGKVANLYWQTSTELNNKGFYVEHSINGVQYTSIGFVASKANNGSSNSLIDYNLIDGHSTTGNNYYRLKQMDFDGRVTISNVILVKNSFVFGMVMHTVYPNPVRNILGVYVESIINENVNFIICDVAGKTVIQQTENLVAGNNNLQINVAKLPAGSYFIKMISRNKYEHILQHFIK